jgi:hypothetical protein
MKSFNEYTIEQEYKNACIKSADATENWNRTWKMTCDVSTNKRFFFFFTTHV